MCDISILHPTRSRPDKSRETVQKWRKLAGVETELIVSVDEDDPCLSSYKLIYPDLLISKNRSAVDAVNNAAAQATGRIMVVLSDDTDCPQNWGATILRATKGKRDFVLKVFDGLQSWIVTQPIIDRQYYERFGYVYNPNYKHQFVDTEFTHIADILQAIIWRNDILFPHKHYSVTRQRPDAVNRRADATWEEGKRTYIRRCRQKFGLGKDTDIYRLSKFARSHIKWMRSHNL